MCGPQDYIYLHKEHNDWITKVQWIPELGLVTSSLDATIKTFDINRCAAAVPGAQQQSQQRCQGCHTRRGPVWHNPHANLQLLGFGRMHHGVTDC